LLSPKKKRARNASEDTRKMELYILLLGMIICVISIEINIEALKKLKLDLPYGSSLPLGLITEGI
jgi:hypothetical protein